MATASISVQGIKKRFKGVEALRGVDFTVEKGTVFGLLGPNGAGKTTLIRILTTLMPPDEGSAGIEGLDVLHHALAVRTIIGLAGQYAAVDEQMTGRENLTMVGRLYHMPRRKALARAVELLRQFDLEAAADRTLSTYSGGMRRRLDLAAALVNRPPVVFLDEPTTGLDPASRLSLWELVRDLVARGTTVLLTTQYLEEADALADRIAILDQGQIIAAGTPRELKGNFADVLELQLADIGQVNRATAALRSAGAEGIRTDLITQRLSVPLQEGTRMLPAMIRALDAAQIQFTDLSVRHPSLDDVFLKYTGHTAQATV